MSGSRSEFSQLSISCTTARQNLFTVTCTRRPQNSINYMCDHVMQDFPLKGLLLLSLVPLPAFSTTDSSSLSSTGEHLSVWVYTAEQTGLFYSAAQCAGVTFKQETIGRSRLTCSFSHRVLLAPPLLPQRFCVFLLFHRLKVAVL